LQKTTELFGGIPLIKIEEPIFTNHFYRILRRPCRSAPLPLGALRQLPHLASRSYSTAPEYQISTLLNQPARAGNPILPDYHKLTEHCTIVVFFGDSVNLAKTFCAFLATVPILLRPKTQVAPTSGSVIMF